MKGYLLINIFFQVLLDYLFSHDQFDCTIIVRIEFSPLGLIDVSHGH